MIIDFQEPNVEGGMISFPDWVFSTPGVDPMERIVIKGCGGDSTTANVAGTLDQSE